MGASSSDGWRRASYKARSGVYSATVVYTTSYQNEWLITPALDLSTATHVILWFYEDEYYWDGWGEHHRIRVSTTSQTDTSTFTTVLDMTPYTHNINGFKGDPVVVDLSSFAGNSTVYVAFQYEGTDADVWMVDDIGVWVAHPNDVRPVALVSPSEYAPSYFTPRVRIQNFGDNPQSNIPIRLIFETLDGTPVYNQVANYTGTLNFFDTATVNFPTFTGSDNRVYRYYIITELPSDNYRGNDTITGYIYTYTTPMMVLFERFTQHNCGPCASADPYQLSIYQSHVDTAYNIGMITYHAWWPGSNNDPFYRYDTMPQRQRIIYYGVNAVPWLVLNGVNNVGPNWTTWASQVSYEESYRKTPVEFKFDLSNTFVDLNGDGFISLWIKQIGEMVNKPYKLRAVIVQDSVYYNAPNGTNFHIMKFRQWRDTSFTALAMGDSVYYSIPFNLVVPPTYPTDPGIELDKLVAVVFIQSDDDKKVWGVGTFPVGRFLGVSESVSKRCSYLPNKGLRLRFIPLPVGW